MFKDTITPRLYQELIFGTATQHNTLVVLPTGLGKTLIGAMLIAHRLKHYPESKAIFVAPTKPLIEQHLRTLKKLLELPEEDFVLFTGAISPAKRAAQFEQAKIILSTPQGLENDILSSRISLKEVSLFIFDEAHRAVGDYSYVFLAKQYEKTATHSRILSLTASPGSDKEKILEVCTNMHVEKIEVRKTTDKDVAPYVQEVDIEWVEVPFPIALQGIRDTLNNCFKNKIERTKNLGYLNVPTSQVNKSTLLKAQGSLHGEMAKGNRDFELLKSMSLLAEAMKIQHAIELIETQGIYALKQYLDDLKRQARTRKTKATKNLLEDNLFKEALYEADNLAEDIEHPKLKTTKKLVLGHLHKYKDAKILLFTQYRDQAVSIQNALSTVGVVSEVFVGQAKKKKTGLSQKEQRIMLDRFSTAEFPVLIATSVAEEGLDIPKVDIVLFYEPVPSAIRTVQRRGRTGRLERGKVIILMTKGTRDVGYRWVAHHKEKRMYRAIDEVKKSFALLTTKDEQPKNKSQQTLGNYSQEQQENITIVADHREKGSAVLKALINQGVTLDLQQLTIGDYLLGTRTIIEYKRIPDFVDSIIDGRLMSQLKQLRQYARPVILIEGEEDMYALRNIHPNAIRGMLATIIVSYNISLLYSKTPHETAALITALAKREQIGGKDFQYHTEKPKTQNEQLEYAVAAIPGIGSTLSKPLLEQFNTIQQLVNAEKTVLESIPGIGVKKAEQIHDFVRQKYEKEL